MRVAGGNSSDTRARLGVQKEAVPEALARLVHEHREKHRRDDNHAEDCGVLKGPKVAARPLSVFASNAGVIKSHCFVEGLDLVSVDEACPKDDDGVDDVDGVRKWCEGTKPVHREESGHQRVRRPH